MKKRYVGIGSSGVKVRFLPILFVFHRSLGNIALRTSISFLACSDVLAIRLKDITKQVWRQEKCTRMAFWRLGSRLGESPSRNLELISQHQLRSIMIEQCSMPSDPLFEVVKVCASLPHVKQEVLRNYEDNQWWPLSIADWRLRLIVPGWSTRVSYNMISTYQNVVNRAYILGYDQLCAMSDEEIACVIAPIGLVHSRIGYFRSVQHFLDQSGMERKALVETENDELIELFAKQVKGAGYKVAQCAILYAKGYHCGICPVDSGMKDMLGPCLGMELPKGSLAHDVMRKVIEHRLNARPEDYNMLADRLGYGHLNLPKGCAPTWWVHLVLIYFKRQYCNMHVPHACPLRVNQSIGMYIGTMCDRHHSRRGTLLKIHSPSLH